MYFNELQAKPAISFNNKPLNFQMNLNEGFFPFYFDEGLDLYIGYIAYRKQDNWIKYDINEILTPEFVKDSQEINLVNRNFSIGFSDQKPFRLFEVYFEKPSITILQVDPEFITSSIDPVRGYIHSLSEMNKRFLMTDGVLIPYRESFSLIIQNPSRYIKGVLWKDYYPEQFEPVNHLLF